MDRSAPEYKVFKKHFWIWFDKLPRRKKQTFWHYKEDMAETNFYFTAWPKISKELFDND